MTVFLESGVIVFDLYYGLCFGLFVHKEGTRVTDVSVDRGGKSPCRGTPLANSSTRNKRHSSLPSGASFPEPRPMRPHLCNEDPAVDSFTSLPTRMRSLHSFISSFHWTPRHVNASTPPPIITGVPWRRKWFRSCRTCFKKSLPLSRMMNFPSTSSSELIT